MVDSTITILPIYLDGRDKTILSGGVSSLEDDSISHESDSRTTSTTERSPRVRQNYQISWGKDSEDVTDIYHVVRTSRGFLFISPVPYERDLVGMPLKNTATGLNTGDGSTATFQLQHQVMISYDIGVGAASSDAFDVNYPLAGTVVAKADGSPVTVSSVNLTTGVVTLSAAPTNGAVMTANFSRAIPVKFTSDSISRTLLQVDQSELRSAQIEEIF